MLAERERRLLFVVAVLVGVSILVAAVRLGVERLRDAREKNALYREQIARLQLSLQSQPEMVALRERLQARLEAEKAHFYAPGEMDPYSFGALVRRRITSRGLEIVRYQVAELKGRGSLEFSVSGPIRSLVFFLKEVSDSPKYWGISSLTLSMREGSGMVDAVLRIGYEEIGF